MLDPEVDLQHYLYVARLSLHYGLQDEGNHWLRWDPAQEEGEDQLRSNLPGFLETLVLAIFWGTSGSVLSFGS